MRITICSPIMLNISNTKQNVYLNLIFNTFIIRNNTDEIKLVFRFCGYTIKNYIKLIAVWRNELFINKKHILTKKT